MKVAIFYHHILKAAETSGKSVFDIMQALGAEGLEGVDINAMDANSLVLEDMEKAGLSVSSLYRLVPVFSGETEKGKQLVDKAAEIGCKNVMLLPGTYPAEMDKKTAQMKSIAPLREITEYGTKKGITVTVEDYDSTRTLFGTSADMRYFEDTVPQLSYTYDTGNFYTVEDPLEAFEALKDKIAHVHLKDYAHAPSVHYTRPRTVRTGTVLYDVPFGHGALPGREILRRLRGIGYKGYMCLEHTEAENMMEANLAAIRWVKKEIEHV